MSKDQTNMKHYIYNIVAGAAMSSLLLAGSSCTDYLDKSADSDVSEATAFQNYMNFQGFVDEIYNCIPDKESCYWTTTFNWGEDEIMNTGEGDAHFSHHMDIGDLKWWYQTGEPNQYFGRRVGTDPTSDDKFNHRTYDHAWYCIRKCNVGLANLKLFAGTEAERKALEGQLYFFRAWWHEEMMQYLGGIPYIEEVLDGGSMTLPRLSYRECCLKAAADFEKAASLLPANWDKTPYGAQTSGHNQIRITRTAALAYAGKAKLWAASPLTAGDKDAIAPQPKGTAYDAALAGEAATLLGTALSEVIENKTPYALATFNYSDIYNHTEASSDEFSYHEIFYTVSQNWKTPGGTETVFRGPGHEGNGTNWNFAKLWGSKIGSLVEHDKIIHQPTANYVNYAYGMANGEPAYIVQGGALVPNTAGGFDPSHPFKDRDPRFYHDIVFDGFRFVTTTIEDSDPFRPQQYCNFQTGGYMRDNNQASRTGYFCQKLNPHQCNSFDGYYNWSYSLQAYLPYMRLAEIYLLYAEALAASNGTTAGGCSLNAVMAINVLRNRVGCAEVPESKSGAELMEIIRRERACELAFEGFRWNDLQRWCLLDKAPYNQKYSQEFKRVHADGEIDIKGVKYPVENEWYRKNDPRDAEVTGWTEKKILDRLIEAKHYWFPFPDSEVYLYEEFGQNPGW